MEDNTLELLELYMDMVEKQDEVISKMGRLLNAYATELKHLRNANGFFEVSESLQREMRALNDNLEEYRTMRE